MTKRATPSRLQRFLELAREYKAAALNGESKKADTANKGLTELGDEILFEKKTSEIKPLLANPDDCVRLWAGLTLLKIFPEEAQATLENLKKRKVLLQLKR